MDRLPLIHPPCCDEQHAAKRRKRNVTDQGRQRQRTQQERQRMDNTGQTGGGATLDRNAGARNRGGRRNAAKERDDQIPNPCPINS